MRSEKHGELKEKKNRARDQMQGKFLAKEQPRKH